jgi:protein-disulfide isomerase
MSNTSKNKSNDEIVVSLDNFAVPGAIILAGIIIALAVFLTNKKGANTVDNTGTENVAGEEADSAGNPEFADATVSIGDAPYLGDKENAKVAIVEFSDYRCSYCDRHTTETYPSIVENYVDTGEIIYVFRDFPIFGEDYPNAARCVYHLAGLDAFKQFHLEGFSLESDDDVYALAKEIGVNEGDFDSCYSSNQYQDEIDSDYQAGQDVGIQGTPGFVVGVLEDGQVTGVLVPGAYPYESFQEILDGFLSE